MVDGAEEDDSLDWEVDVDVVGVDLVAEVDAAIATHDVQVSL
jgi:hypothetical protein